jgi:hypothetical protein
MIKLYEYTRYIVAAVQIKNVGCYAVALSSYKNKKMNEKSTLFRGFS